MRRFGTKNHALWSTQKKERTFGVTEFLKDDRVPKLHEDVLVRAEDLDFLVFNPKTDMVLQTNPVGAEIFRHCNGRRNISEISKSITDIFQIGEEIAHRDVKAFLLELAELNLIEYV
jgi:hypothetical protein